MVCSLLYSIFYNLMKESTLNSDKKPCVMVQGIFLN